MNMLSKLALTAAVAIVGSSSAFAGCGVSSGSVRIIANDFPASQAVSAEAMKCDGGGASVAVNLNKDYKDLIVAAMTANPAEYTTSHATNSTLVTLMNDDLVRPLNDYVAKYSRGIAKSQLITVDGNVMAIAFMANAQHLFYRQDILDAAGVGVPASYDEVLAAAKAIKGKGLMDYPIAGTYKAGWNLGEEFVNMYLGHGGSFFKAGSAEPAINNAQGVATLNMMKALSEYMNPDFLTHDSNAVQASWEAGNVAMTNLWGSRAGAVTDGEGSTADIEKNTKFASAPTAAGGSIPSSTLWWDGFAIAKNISDADAEATFQVIMAGISPDMAKANADKANWLMAGVPARAAGVGVIATAQGAAAPYPMLPYMGTLHGAAGGELADFLQGKESAEQALADIEAAYRAAAKEKGFL
jgi:ABC-type glycerol-3-phosphate transport system substrate-binding protein